MLNNEAEECTCNGESYSANCPQAFVQGGKTLHTIENEVKTKPRVFINRAGASHNSRVEDDFPEDQNLMENSLIRNHSTTSEIRDGKMIVQGDDALYSQIENSFPRGLSLDTAPARQRGQASFMESEDMMEQNRGMLRKYEPLKVGGLQLTDLSIGGFEVDLSKAAQKASSVAPLPPAKLPRIYIDPNMNFLHHFFQGLDRLLGRDKVLMLVGQDRYYTTAELILLPLIEDIIKVGWEKRDTNLTVFAKSVLSSTFECDERSGPDQEQRGLIVEANLWGFQYIECGMEMKESDLRMWLSINYNHFRMIHFNTFKDSGMPAFAMEGVQTRYEAVKPKRAPSREQIQKGVEMTGALVPYKVYPNDSDDELRSQSGRRRRQHRKPEPTIGTLLFGKRGR